MGQKLSDTPPPSTPPPSDGLTDTYFAPQPSTTRSRLESMTEISAGGARPLRSALRIWVPSHVVFFVIAWITTKTVQDAAGKDAGLPVAVWPFRLFSQWDAGHFLRVAMHGYYPGPGNKLQAVSTPFLPGFPFAGRWLAEILGMGHTTLADYYAGLALVSWASSIVAAALLWKLAYALGGKRVADRAVLVLLVGPYAVFIVAPYSESLFLALAIAAWQLARKDRWWFAGIAAAAASLVRINGLFLAAALATMFVITARRQARKVVTPQLLSLLLAPLTTFGYFAWIRSRTGSWTTWSTAQRVNFNRKTELPWITLTNSVRRALIDQDGWVRFQAWLEILFAIILMFAIVLLARLKRWPEAVYLSATAASLMTSTYYLSIPRNCLTCFPLAILAAEHLALPRVQVVWKVVVVASLILAILNTVTFTANWWTD